MDSKRSANLPGPSSRQSGFVTLNDWLPARSIHIQVADGDEQLLNNNANDSRGGASCAICSDSIGPGNTPQGKLTNNCSHADDVCLDCVAKSLESQAGRKIWNQLSCPICHSRLDYDDVKKYATADVFSRYDQMATYDAMAEIPGFRYCRQKSCGAAQIHYEQHEMPTVMCIACGNKTCCTHDVQWHEGITCSQYDAESNAIMGEHIKAEDASKAAIASSTKRCPKCERPIEKDGGCQHMTCTICGHEFCWNCLASWKRIKGIGNTAHDSSFPWHSGNLSSSDSN